MAAVSSAYVDMQHLSGRRGRRAAGRRATGGQKRAKRHGTPSRTPQRVIEAGSVFLHSVVEVTQ
jgi:hypothetical protein